MNATKKAAIEARIYLLLGLLLFIRLRDHSVVFVAISLVAGFRK